MNKKTEYLIAITFWALIMFSLFEDTTAILNMILFVSVFILFELADLTDKKNKP